MAQELTITGTVTTKVSGEPLPGTNVVIKGTNFGTSTDEPVPAPTQTIERTLSGKIAGISLSQNTGAPGGGINVNQQRHALDLIIQGG